MIQSKTDLRLYLAEDLKALNQKKKFFKPQSFWSLIFLYDNAFYWHYLKHLRYAEYYYNVKNNKIGKLKLYWHNWRRRYYALFLSNIEIPLNTLGYGTKFFHKGKIIIATRSHLGNYCWLYPGICIGAGKTDEVPIIEDHVFIGVNAGIYGGVRIGKDAFISPNSVVTHDVAAGTIVGGRQHAL